MDRRSFCKVLGFAAGSTLLPGLMVRAAGQGSVGHAVPDGRYTIGIRSDLSGCDLTHAFYYSDSFFTHPATQYDHQLALATLGLVCAAANTVASDAEYWVNGSVGREAHIPAAYETLGFEDALFYNYDLDTGRAGDFVGYSLARKSFDYNGQKRTLVALMLRGMRIAVRCSDKFGTLLAAGITSSISVQAFLNMGVVVGILPTTGLPLPFFSAGGTSISITMAAIGILLNISRESAI